MFACSEYAVAYSCSEYAGGSSRCRCRTFIHQTMYIHSYTKQCIYIHTHTHTLSLLVFSLSLSLSLTHKHTYTHAVVAEETVALFLEYARGSARCRGTYTLQCIYTFVHIHTHSLSSCFLSLSLSLSLTHAHTHKHTVVGKTKQLLSS